MARDAIDRFRGKLWKSATDLPDPTNKLKYEAKSEVIELCNAEVSCSPINSPRAQNEIEFGWLHDDSHGASGTIILII
jgi:hypothetical protein